MLRVEWGPVGGVQVARYAAESGAAVCAVVVDVLSFTTTVSVALDRGMTVHPYRWGEDGAEQFAREHGAVLAMSRRRARAEGGVSLSPGSIRQSAARRIVLPSPNGSTITALLDEAGATVVAASLRNRRAVGTWLVGWLQSLGREEPVIVVVPAGERWPDGSLRPAAEDLWGAGAVVAALVERLPHEDGPMLLSPEAQLASAAYVQVGGSLGHALGACASGRELVEAGFSDDVSIAAELDASPQVPVLRDGAFVRAPAH